MSDKITSISAHPSNCIGCMETGAAVMLSLTLEGSEEGHDFFLSQSQAIKLMGALLFTVNRNRDLEAQDDTDPFKG